MVYMGVDVTACSKIYSDGVKAGVPHWLAFLNGLWCIIDVV
jgi:hypothetical protein